MPVKPILAGGVWLSELPPFATFEINNAGSSPVYVFDGKGARVTNQMLMPGQSYLLVNRQGQYDFHVNAQCEMSLLARALAAA